MGVFHGSVLPKTVVCGRSESFAYYRASAGLEVCQNLCRIQTNKNRDFGSVVNLVGLSLMWFLAVSILNGGMCRGQRIVRVCASFNI